MVPWTHVREHFLKWMWTDLTSEFTHFNVVIHLSSETVGLSVMHLFRRPAAPVVMGNFHSVPVKPCRTTSLSIAILPNYHKPSFLPLFKRQHVLFLQVWYSLVSGEVKHIVHLIHLNLNSCLCPCGLTWLWSRLGVTQDYLRLNWIPFSLLSFFLLFTS